MATFFNFAKASIGSGSFALSWGILKTGVVLGSAGMVLLSIARCVITDFLRSGLIVYYTSACTFEVSIHAVYDVWSVHIVTAI